MSFNPSTDGHIIWNFIHLMAANAVTPAKREFYVNTINGFKISFPCEFCREHLITNLESLPVEPYSNNNISLFYHSWKLHDTVNGQLKKPANQRLTYDQAFAKWFPNQTPPPSSAPTQPENPMAEIRNNQSSSPVCTSCGNNVVESAPVDYTQFRKIQKRGFLRKNN